MAFNAYHLADLVRTAAGLPSPHRFTTAIVAAAGASRRMGGDISKQLLELDGIPVLARTLLAYQAAETVDEIVMVARREEFEPFRALAEQYHITKLKRITEGGETRQDSVLRGLAVVSAKTKFVAIADGARCLITPEAIDEVNRTAWRTGAATAATPAIDTVKLSDAKGNIAKDSPERERVWLAQTPQTFALPLYRAAAYHAREKGLAATDDNSLVEAIGRPVTLVDCGRQNLKITTPEDIAIASAILIFRQNQVKKKED